ncbi:MAG TPA: type II secretion system F family protein [Victivallales bacterium]|nr:type II secretion system F family protein [Victivallales bacterium]HPO91160.1 type II secretion system F family protein [Victivallales bacterium]HRU01000.1 type II secretion system F family protein [Victivallales bacterium]
MKEFPWLSIAASLCSGISVSLASIIIIDFFSIASSRYKEKYLKEASTEYDEVILQMPPERVLDLTIAISFLCALTAITFLGIVGNSWSWGKALCVGIIAFIISFPLPKIYIRHLKKQRLFKFNEQLEDALNSMSSALKAGFSINQAIEVIAEENIKPISIEFRLLVQELRLGVPLEKALDNMVKRLNSDDFELVATAILTARQTGGELTVVFERLAAVIRERMRIASRLRALTAQGRLQAYIVGALPYLLMIVMNYINPDMMSGFFNSYIGIGVIVLASVLVFAGFMTIKKITNIDI